MTADLGPAATPRPIPTQEDRMTAATADNQLDTANRREYPTSFGTYLDRTERDQLDAEAACARQERDDALDDLQTARADLQQLRTKLDLARGQRDEALEARDVLRAQLDQQSAILASKRNTISALAAELGAAQEVIAVIDDATERIDRARATYATRRQQEATTPGLGSPAARAQDERTRIEEAIEKRLREAWPNWPIDDVWLEQVAAQAAIAAVDAKRAEKAEG